MMVDGLLRRLFNAHHQAQGYADDVVLLQNDRMQSALNCVEHWCREIGLFVNADKTTMVLFTNNRKIGGSYKPRFFGTELRVTDQGKYLGVILDKKLDWKAHLENRMHKACISYCPCRRAVEKTWRLSLKVFWKRVELKNGSITCSGSLVWELLVVCVQHQRLL
jgi:hypothetical protein